MPIIYKPTGKAGEYIKNADGTPGYAINTYTGCDHGCDYCFARSMHKRFGRRGDFDSPKVRPGYLGQIEKEAQALASGQTVHLCFTCDPYSHLDWQTRHTRATIEILHQYGHRVQVLTKGGSRAQRDLGLFLPTDSFGTTLTLWDLSMSRAFEPQAADPIDRIYTMELFHQAGIPTWASLEPVIDPDQTLFLIQQSAPHCDLYKVGKWNYDRRARDIDWAQFVKNAISLLTQLGKPYLIKQDLQAYLSE